MNEKHRRTQTTIINRDNIQDDEMLHMLDLTQAVMDASAPTHERLHGYVTKKEVAAKDKIMAEAQEMKRRRDVLERSFSEHRKSQSIGLANPDNRMYNQALQL